MPFLLYKDVEMLRPISSGYPKWFLFPKKGGEKLSSIFLGNKYSTSTRTVTTIGTSSIDLVQVNEISPTGGTLQINGQFINYTGVSGTTVTGIIATGTGSVLHAIPAESQVIPILSFSSVSLVLSVQSSLALDPTRVSFLDPATGFYGIPGAPLILPPQTIINAGVPLEIFFKVYCPVGTTFTSTGWKIKVNGFIKATITAYLGIHREDQSMKTQIRVVEPERFIQKTTPGFVLGSYRWRDRSQISASALRPTSWDANLFTLGEDKFLSGTAQGPDLSFDSLQRPVNNQSSIVAKINTGFYFNGPQSYYLPGDGFKIEFLPAFDPANLIHTLTSVPKAQSPVFVGQWKIDSQGFYDNVTQYRYWGTLLPINDLDPTELKFSLDKSTKTLTINKTLDPQTLFIGIAPAAGTSALFELPFYPMQSVERVFSTSGVYTNFSFDQDNGTLKITSAGFTGESIYARCIPALAVVYETDDSKPTRSLTDIDLNPAFSGVSKGFLSLQHRRPKPTVIAVSVDKPNLPLTPDLVLSNSYLYGPVYYENDFALVLATVYGYSVEDPVPGIKLRVVPGTHFEGLLNYQDPTTAAVYVTTGGDGVANLVYTPPSGYGQWISLPLSPPSDNSIVLPTSIPYSSLFDSLGSWKGFIYTIEADDPFLGMIGADVALGQTPYVSYGAPGTSSFRTNGRHKLLTGATGLALLPVSILDTNNVPHTSSAFNGQVKTLTYTSNIPVTSFTKAYFVSFIGFPDFTLVSDTFNLTSGNIVLSLTPPEQIIDNVPAGTPIVPAGYLRPNTSSTGRININRLGGAPLPEITFNTNRF